MLPSLFDMNWKVKALRVAVEGGGCSGFSYKFDLAEDAEADDVVITRGDAKVLIDEISLVYMAGSEIDFVDDIMGQAFQIKNPLAATPGGPDGAMMADLRTMRNWRLLKLGRAAGLLVGRSAGGGGTDSLEQNSGIDPSLITAAKCIAVIY